MPQTIMGDPTSKNTIKYWLLFLPLVLCACSQSEQPELPFTPTFVATPPANAFRSLWRAPDGSIHSHGFLGTARNPEGIITLISNDEGLTWTKEPFTIKRAEYKEDPFHTYIPTSLKQDKKTGDWLAIMDGKEPYLTRWAGNPWEVTPTTQKITDRALIMMRPPIFIRNGSRIIAAGHNHSLNPAGGWTSIYHSDDGGATWNAAHLEKVPDHTITPPHQGLRWQNPGVEPTIVELKDGRLWCLLRASLDRHYETYSEDGGATWSRLRPSPFWGTITMKTFHRLPDGRLMLVWTNASPLPETPHHTREQGKKDWETGRQEVFTNRDTLHAALSYDEGKTWTGFREILRNRLRNEPDFGTSHGGVGPSNDRSVHQSQVIDLKDDRVLVQAGQHPALRSLLIMHPDWLLEKSQADDFSHGLDAWHVQQFKAGVVGHCAYNRQTGAELVANPANSARQVLSLKNLPDESLVSSVQGALWHFPVGRSGTLKTSLYLPKDSQGGVIALNDRWLAPIDEEVRAVAPFLLHIRPDGTLNNSDIRLVPDTWHSLTITWSYDEESAQISLANQSATFPFTHTPILPHGFSYLHLQSSLEPDDNGFLIGPVSVQVD
ncbi:glycoside hydrolase [Opitutia bacterium ISCC 51]|nr:glycoside hydrolase [Opitutae bacterium ISCC 51]QXD27631.1 glycoside hydrolase [Opitutae bacterium ISCC 52]